MQVVYPIDLEDALRIDLTALNKSYRFCCVPIPYDLKAGDVVITPLGGSAVSGASHVQDVSIGCYASCAKDAREMSDTVHGLVSSLPLRNTSTQYSAASASTTYEDNDPRAPQLSRYSFRASITCPGTRISF